MSADGVKRIAGRTLQEWEAFARRDDCLDRMVPIELRCLIACLYKLGFDDGCAALAAMQPAPTHSDDKAVDRFAVAMKAKLAKKRNEGRGGWEGPDCSQGVLSGLLHEHVGKGDPVDVANLAMMLHQRGQTIAAMQPTPAEAAKVLPHSIMVWRSRPTLDHTGTWATTRYPDDAVEYVPRANFDRMENAAQIGLAIAKLGGFRNIAEVIAGAIEGSNHD